MAIKKINRPIAWLVLAGLIAGVLFAGQFIWKSLANEPARQGSESESSLIRSRHYVNDAQYKAECYNVAYSCRYDPSAPDFVDIDMPSPITVTSPSTKPYDDPQALAEELCAKTMLIREIYPDCVRDMVAQLSK